MVSGEKPLRVARHRGVNFVPSTPLEFSLTGGESTSMRIPIRLPFGLVDFKPLCLEPPPPFPSLFPTIEQGSGFSVSSITLGWGGFCGVSALGRAKIRQSDVVAVDRVSFQWNLPF